MATPDPGGLGASPGMDSRLNSYLRGLRDLEKEMAATVLTIKQSQAVVRDAATVDGTNLLPHTCAHGDEEFRIYNLLGVETGSIAEIHAQQVALRQCTKQLLVDGAVKHLLDQNETSIQTLPTKPGLTTTLSDASSVVSNSNLQIASYIPPGVVKKQMPLERFNSPERLMNEIVQELDAKKFEYEPVPEKSTLPRCQL